MKSFAELQRAGYILDIQRDKDALCSYEKCANCRFKGVERFANGAYFCRKLEINVKENDVCDYFFSNKLFQ